MPLIKASSAILAAALERRQELDDASLVASPRREPRSALTKMTSDSASAAITQLAVVECLQLFASGMSHGSLRASDDVFLHRAVEPSRDRSSIREPPSRTARSCPDLHRASATCIHDREAVVVPFSIANGSQKEYGPSRSSRRAVLLSRRLDRDDVRLAWRNLTLMPMKPA